MATLKQLRPNLDIIINGGINALDAVNEHLQWADGVMLGRAAYHNPGLLSTLDHHLFSQDRESGYADPDPTNILLEYRRYIERQLRLGEPLHAMTRHMLSACNGIRGARRYRQILSDSKRLKRNDIALLDEALAQLIPQVA